MHESRAGTNTGIVQRAADCAAQGGPVCGGLLRGDGGGASPSPGLVSSKTSPLQIPIDPASTARKRIKRLRRSVWAAGHLHGLSTRGHRPPVAHMATLTYVGVHDWRADHISQATEQYRRWCARSKVACRYIWVAELQKRGAVHYHLIAWLPKGVPMPHWDTPISLQSGRLMKPMWSHGMTNTEQCRTGVGYLMKYLSKLGPETIFPPHLRLYGVGGLTPEARSIRSWYNLPEWAKREHGVGDLQRLGSRLIVCDTGEILPPMYSRSFKDGSLLLFPLRDMPPRWHDGAYSTWRPTL